MNLSLEEVTDIRTKLDQKDNPSNHSWCKTRALLLIAQALISINYNLSVSKHSYNK